MNQISNIKIDGFRRLDNVDLPMRPFNVLIGANGVGKTSLLDVFDLLSQSAAGNLNKTLSEMYGIGSILTRGRAETLAFQVDMEGLDQTSIQYRLSIVPDGAGYTIDRETLSQQTPGQSSPLFHIDSADNKIGYYNAETKHLESPTWDHDPTETSLAQVEKMFRLPANFRSILSSATRYHELGVNRLSPVKLPQQMRPAQHPGVNGEDLIPFLYYMKEEDPDRYETIIDTLKAAFENFESLHFPPVAAGALSMTLRNADAPKPMYIHELSEGTLRFIWLVSLLQSPDLPTITLIDEPEISLHPELLSLLAGLMREASQRTQLIVATHSDRLIRFLNPEEVIAMDIGEDGCAIATWADEFDLDDWLSEYSLDEVWQMGRIGGRS